MKNIQIARIDTRKTGHLYIEEYGNEVSWLILHGYAQAPEDLLQCFPEKRGHRFIAAEGLSRFYRKGFEGEVVSSWMTSKHRLDEIKDQKDWLDRVYERYFSDDEGRMKIAFAYSQGAATLFRWLADRSPSFDQIWIWAGSIPQDVSYKKLSEYLRDSPFHFFGGSDDPFLPEDYLDRCMSRAVDLDLEAHTHSYEGGHHVLPDKLDSYIDDLINRRDSSKS